MIDGGKRHGGGLEVGEGRLAGGGEREMNVKWIVEGRRGR